MLESGFEKTTRLGLEARIRDHFTAGDIKVVDELLDIYPSGRTRPDMSLEQARHAANMAIRGEQFTDAFPVITPEMLEQ